MRRGDRPRLFHAHLSTVAVAGVAALTLMVVQSGDQWRHWPQIVVLGLCTFVGELRPVQVLPGRWVHNFDGLVTTSSAFAFALLLLVGPGPAVLCLCFSSAIADLSQSKGLYKSAYNVGQYSLSIAAPAAVVAAMTGSSVLMADGRVASSDVIPLIAAVAAFFVVNSVLVGTAVSLAGQLPVLKGVWDELTAQAFVEGILLAMAPVIVVVSTHNLGLLPFLLLPVAACYSSNRDSLAKEHQALHDSLTGLPNRTLFHQVVTAAAAKQAALSAVLLIDLDRFKEINDTLGHHVGDLLLKEIGPRLRRVVRDGDHISRLGGDEFVIFLPDVDTVETVVDIASRARAALSEPIMVEDLQLHVDGSIGIALAPEHGTDVDMLLQRADVAMYQAKESHGGSCLYTPDLDPNSRRRLKLLSDLRVAIDDGDLVLHYQPKADLRARRIGDVEALVRWVHPELGMIPPNDFIPLAEHSGLIGPLTEYVLKEAIGRAADWRRRGTDLRVSVNLSVRSLADLGLPERIAELLSAAALPASFLELEITESTVMADPLRAMRVLQPLADMGVRLSIDDFGTGYSSLAYLRQLPISELKIDRSFIAAMPTSENDRVIVRSTIEMARNLGLEVVAEGVETPDVEAALDAMGCDFIQGYLLSKPLPADQLETRLRELRHEWCALPHPLPR